MIDFKFFLLYLIRPLWIHIKLSVFKAKWRKINPENLTEAVSFFPMEKVRVGKGTYGKLNIYTDYNRESFLEIGNFCSIATEVKFLLDGGHDYERCTTYPFPKVVYNMGVDATTKGGIIVEDDVWIGQGAMILSGVTLGKGCVIGARSVVTKNVPPYAVYAGYEIKKYRFSEDIIQKLMPIEFSKIDRSTLQKYKPFCQDKVRTDNIDDILRVFMASEDDG